MKSVLGFALAASMSIFTTAVVAEETNTNSIVAKCKSEASSEEIPAAELQNFLRQCLQDYGVSEGDVEKAMKGVGSMPKKEED